MKPNSAIVCILTGNGLKDPDNAIKFGNASHTKLGTDINQISDFFRL